jgi:hypothetical protein
MNARSISRVVKRNTRRGLLVVGALAAFLAAAPLAAAQQVEFRLAFDGLGDLGPSAHYEGWVIVDGTPISTGSFTVSNGVPSRDRFSAMVDDPTHISAFVLTIEPTPDPDPAPSATHYLAGTFDGPRATLTVAHPAALGNDFLGAAGAYLLAAPTGGSTASYKNGIWWLDPTAGPGPTLTLPTLPAGWVYEGWVVGPSGPVSTGRFTMATGADSDGPGPAAGANQAPPFPGQDFVNPATDLTMGYAAVITVEPDPDNSPAPFTLKPLVDSSIDDTGSGVLQMMANNAASFPTGTATMLKATYVVTGGHIAGYSGTMWKTDLEVHNGGTTASMFDIELLERGKDNSAPMSRTFSLAPGMSMRYTDVFQTLFGVTGTGAIRVWSDKDASIKVASTTYNDSSAGIYGAAVPGMPDSAAIGIGTEARLIMLSYSSTMSSGRRTNIGIVSASPMPIDVAADLYLANGTMLGSVEIPLLPFEQQQVDNIFGMVTSADVPDGYAVVRARTPGALFFAYASVVRNASGAPVIILP